MGWQEILLVLMVALIIFGPGRITEIGRTLGKAFRVLRQATTNITAQMTKEIMEENPPKKEKKGGSPEKAAKS